MRVCICWNINCYQMRLHFSILPIQFLNLPLQTWDYICSEKNLLKPKHTSNILQSFCVIVRKCQRRVTYDETTVYIYITNCGLLLNFSSLMLVLHLSEPQAAINTSRKSILPKKEFILEMYYFFFFFFF